MARYVLVIIKSNNLHNVVRTDWHEQLQCEPTDEQHFHYSCPPQFNDSLLF